MQLIPVVHDVRKSFLFVRLFHVINFGEIILRSTKENAYYSCTVHEVVTVLYAMRFHGLDAILDRPGTLYLDLMCSVFLARELVSIL